MDRSVAFYDCVLAQLGYARANQSSTGAPCWNLAKGAGIVFSIALHQARIADRHDRYTPGLHHLAFAVNSKSEVDDFYAFLVDAGIPILDPPQEYDYTPGYYAVFFSDPDGIKLEIVYEPVPVF